MAVRVERGDPDTKAERLVLEAIDDGETVELLREFIALDTENPPGHEAIIARALGARLQSAASSIRLVEVVPGRENLEARFGPAGRQRLVINGHTDTMPAGIGWTSPPHEPTRAGDTIRGRGACDVKGGLAASVEALLAISRAGVPLPARSSSTPSPTRRLAAEERRARLLTGARPTGRSSSSRPTWR